MILFAVSGIWNSGFFLLFLSLITNKQTWFTFSTCVRWAVSSDCSIMSISAHWMSEWIRGWHNGNIRQWGSTALHWSLFKCLTAQDTCGTATLTKHNRTLARYRNLLYLQPRSTIKKYIGFFFFKPLNWVNWSVFPFLKPNKITQWCSNLIILYLCQ